VLAPAAPAAIEYLDAGLDLSTIGELRKESLTG
jgi:hypothetical protein